MKKHANRLATIAAVIAFAVALILNLKSNAIGNLSMQNAFATAGTEPDPGLWQDEKYEDYDSCPIIELEGVRWEHVTGTIAVGAEVTTPLGPATVEVDASGEKGYWEKYKYQTTGKGKEITCVKAPWSVCDAAIICPGNGGDEYMDL